jgi:hypothetical protein
MAFMPRTKPPYPEEFRRDAVGLVRAEIIAAQDHPLIPVRLERRREPEYLQQATSLAAGDIAERRTTSASVSASTPWDTRHAVSRARRHEHQQR